MTANTMQEMQGHFECPQGNIAIVAARFNEMVVANLIAGAIDALTRHGLKTTQIEVVRVPGAFEIPLVCQQLARTKRFAGIIALGTVIRGETPHFDYVASACANGVLQAQMQTNIPIAFGVLTTETLDQALARAGSKSGNKGADAAMSLLEVISLLGKIHD
jgi:6,7-dimethyl-8-ribityllumazine synthase